MAFLRKVVSHNWQVYPVEETLSNTLHRNLKKTFVNGTKCHVRAFGVLWCSQIQHENLADHSSRDCSYRKLWGTRPRAITIGPCFCAPAMPAPGCSWDLEVCLPENCASGLKQSSQAWHNMVKGISSCVSASFYQRGIPKCRHLQGQRQSQRETLVELQSCNYRLRHNTSLAATSTGRTKSFYSYSRPISLCKHFVHENRRPVEAAITSLRANHLQFLRKTQRMETSALQMHTRHYVTRPRKPALKKREKSYYEVLNITPNTTQAQVKQAYFKLSKIYHPDKNAGSREAQRQFAAINEAYSVLGSLTLRKRYDRGMLSQRDVHGEVKEEDKVRENATSEAMYTGTGIPFSEEAKRHAKNMDDFFSKHYKEALQKEKRGRAERQQRIDEYLELQQKAKVSPIVLAVFMVFSVVLAVRSVTSNRPGKQKLEAAAKDEN